jgi:hypothetical protein
MIYFAVLAFLAVVAAGLTWALSVEQSKVATLADQIADHTAKHRAQQTIIRKLTLENKELWQDLATARIERDIRPPAHPVAEWLATHGTSHIADLIAVYGRGVSRDLVELQTAGVVETDNQHLHWWAVPPIERQAAQTRVVKAMAPR